MFRFSSFNIILLLHNLVFALLNFFDIFQFAQLSIPHITYLCARASLEMYFIIRWWANIVALTQTKQNKTNPKMNRQKKEKWFEINVSFLFSHDILKSTSSKPYLIRQIYYSLNFEFLYFDGKREREREAPKSNAIQ